MLTNSLPSGCQKDHWKSHKPECKKSQEERREKELENLSGKRFVEECRWKIDRLDL